jgi:hypothetical protein
VLIAFDQEVGRADVAGIAFTDSGNVIDRLRFGCHPRTQSVTTGTEFRRVLENALNVTLLALQCCVHIPQDKAGLYVIEIGSARDRCGLGKMRKTKHYAHQRNSYSFADPTISLVHPYLPGY